MKEYSALLIDLKSSRKYSIQERNTIQEYIIRVIDKLNRIFETSAVKAVDFSAGDEIQGLFTSAGAAYLYFRLFSMLVSPVEIRAGIGVGAWDVVVENAGTTAQDGPAYHKARRAIKSAEESRCYSVLFCSGKPDDKTINTLLNCASTISGRQYSNQSDIMLLTELLYPVSNHILKEYNLKEFTDLLKTKKDLFCGEKKAENGCRSNDSLFDKLNYDDIDIRCCPLNYSGEDSSFFIEDGKVRGLSSLLASLSGTSRQSIERAARTGMITEIRNLAITTLNYMEEIQS